MTHERLGGAPDTRRVTNCGTTTLCIPTTCATFVGIIYYYVIQYTSLLRTRPTPHRLQTSANREFLGLFRV